MRFLHFFLLQCSSFASLSATDILHSEHTYNWARKQLDEGSRLFTFNWTNNQCHFVNERPIFLPLFDWKPRIHCEENLGSKFVHCRVRGRVTQDEAAAECIRLMTKNTSPTGKADDDLPITKTKSPEDDSTIASTEQPTSTTASTTTIQTNGDIRSVSSSTSKSSTDTSGSSVELTSTPESSTNATSSSDNSTVSDDGEDTTTVAPTVTDRTTTDTLGTAVSENSTRTRMGNSTKHPSPISNYTSSFVETSTTSAISTTAASQTSSTISTTGETTTAPATTSVATTTASTTRMTTAKESTTIAKTTMMTTTTTKRKTPVASTKLTTRISTSTPVAPTKTTKAPLTGQRPTVTTGMASTAHTITAPEQEHRSQSVVSASATSSRRRRTTTLQSTRITGFFSTTRPHRVLTAFLYSAIALVPLVLIIVIVLFVVWRRRRKKNLESDKRMEYLKKVQDSISRQYESQSSQDRDKTTQDTTRTSTRGEQEPPSQSMRTLTGGTDVTERPAKVARGAKRTPLPKSLALALDNATTTRAESITADDVFA